MCRSWVESDCDDQGADPGDRRVPRCAIRAATAAKAHFGLLGSSTANRLVLHNYIATFMSKDMGMRPRHIVEFCPIAVELALLPTESDLFARSIRRNIVLADLRDMCSNK